MQTVTDILFSRDLAIATTGAVIGGLLLSLCAALFWASPRWLSNLRTWRANWSKKSAEKRANQLRDELQKIDELRNDLSQYVGFLIGDTAKALFSLVLSVMFFLIFDDTRHLPVYSRSEASVCFLSWGIALTVASYYSGRVGKYSNLAKHKARVVEQLDRLRLHGRWGVESK